MILYIHGFRSKGNGEKAKALQAYFPNEEVISPSLITKPLIDIETLRNIINARVKKEKTIIIGTSLGGFYAYCLSRVFRIPCLLINPSLNPSESLKDSLGVNTIYGSEKKGDTTLNTLELTIEDLKNFKALENHLNSIPINPFSNALLNFVISVDDEIINHALNLIKFKGCNIKLFDNAGHIFTKFNKILPDIKEILNN